MANASINNFRKINIFLKAGDSFLLCSDGLSNLVSNEEICEALSTETTLDVIATALIQLANDRGGDDNSTAVLVERLPD